MQARRKHFTAVASSIFLHFRRIGRSSSPLCCVGVFAFNLTSLMAPAGQPTEIPSPALAATPAAIESTATVVPAATPEPLAPPPVAAPATPSVPAVQKAIPVPKKVLSLAFDESSGVPRAPYGELIYEVALRHAVNPHLVAALIHVESAFNPRAVSRKGARGLMQLLPATARRFGLTKKGDLFDPVKNLEAGVRYIKWLTGRFGGDAQRVLAAYNAGEGAVDRFGGIPPYRETQSYVKKIFGLLGVSQPTAPDAEAPSAPIVPAILAPAEMPSTVEVVASGGL